jgi:hypothetical protein
MDEEKIDQLDFAQFINYNGQISNTNRPFPIKGQLEVSF